MIDARFVLRRAYHDIAFLNNDSSPANGGSAANSAAASPSSASTPAAATLADQAYNDTDVYGAGPNDSVADTKEAVAVSHHSVTIGGKTIAYTARAGHLTTIDASTSQPNAKMFYVAYTADNPDPTKPRPVTFFYNGGPGSSSVYLLLGSFGPKRIQSSFPNFTPPAPYKLLDNPDSLLDRSDLVFINPVGADARVEPAAYSSREAAVTVAVEGNVAVAGRACIEHALLCPLFTRYGPGTAKPATPKRAVRRRARARRRARCAAAPRASAWKSGCRARYPATSRSTAKST